ncbi:NAD(P)H-dependent oxidoreductase [Erysipelothrix sp. HDW6C]|uniref:NAD(P)H-dependent oxidoreductase n=1 Tax=Erysipelothrix sp. HDW6C TaxID=2714930 RepID=UPI00140CCDAB|nr:NAD(P)H-dependent oxidoreductase [Erysipelothrix sp. HDW6C]QIK68942.1 NAD(P)H-dependent oxidoreductase [Erysipelothrix sp. HDW6C]
MKNTLIIFAYPNHRSLNYEIYKRVKAGQEKRGNTVVTLDLYQDNFDPILRFDAQNRRRDMQYREDMKKYRDQVSWADHIIFIYPIWWGSMPAIMKGYLEKVFTTGFSYNFKGLFPQGHLKGKTASLITTDDTPPIFRVVALQDYGNVLKNQVLRIMTGIRVKKHIRMTYIKGRKPEKIERWLQKCYEVA